MRSFLEAWGRAYPDEKPDAFAALGYDTVRLVADAMDRASSPTPEALRRALAETKDFQGVTGMITYPPGERIPRKSVSVLKTGPRGSQLAEELVPRAVPAP